MPASHWLTEQSVRLYYLYKSPGQLLVSLCHFWALEYARCFSSWTKCPDVSILQRLCSFCQCYRVCQQHHAPFFIHCLALKDRFAVFKSALPVWKLKGISLAVIIPLFQIGHWRDCFQNPFQWRWWGPTSAVLVLYSNANISLNSLSISKKI